MNKRCLAVVMGIIVLSISVLVDAPAIALTYLHVIPTTLTVTSGVSDVSVYSDAACLQEITVLDIGDLEQNQAWTKTVYVKNNGTATVDVGLMAEGNTSFGMVMFTPSGLFNLVPGASKAVEISVYVQPDAVENTYNFSLIVYD